ncbi:AbgT family transporter [Lipingzhangella sp. LS1_29]|uniref:AbgT family transporter n=1 Tax=Lipingzhangella rawalii TaxID=2055835 RepID=A0ABU2HA43_9ACTN|nr:AbgT family transporter [Lipingzhangella rawalii]MDS1271877.1 AbgT family transporter [Lipingzhangella rawalii]
MSLVLAFLRGIERVGNRLPHPFWLFAGMAVAVILLSELLSRLGAFAVSPVDGDRIEVRSLLSPDGIDVIFGDAIENYVNFPPLGLIVVMMLGVVVAEQTGLLNALLRGSVVRVPAKYMTFTVALVGICGSVASDAAYVVLIPLAAVVFQAVGRSPTLGIVVAFAAVSAGWNATLFVVPTDALLGGISTEAARLVDDDAVVTPIANYFFNVGSAVMLALLITLVTELLLRKRTAGMDGEESAGDELGSLALRSAERWGLVAAGLTLLVAAGMFLAALVPEESWFRGEDGTVMASPLVSEIALVLAIVFLAIGVAYGIVAGTVTKPADVPVYMAKGIRDLAPVLVLFFAAAQFLAYFDWSGMAEVLAIRGAAWLGDLALPTSVLFVGFIALAALLNMFITSGSAQWTLIAPVFVPMLMLLGINPETTQALYRIADSSTNIITPMSPYFVLVLGFMQRYRRDSGIGTLVSLTLPFSVAIFVMWTLFFLGWYALGLPLGPGVPVH